MADAAPMSGSVYSNEGYINQLLAKAVDDHRHLIAAGYGERAVRTEIVLHVDDDENVAVADCIR